MKATPEDVAKQYKQLACFIDAYLASMKATPEDVAKSEMETREAHGGQKPQ